MTEDPFPHDASKCVEFYQIRTFSLFHGHVSVQKITFASFDTHKLRTVYTVGFFECLYIKIFNDDFQITQLWFKVLHIEKGPLICQNMACGPISTLPSFYGDIYICTEYNLYL